MWIAAERKLSKVQTASLGDAKARAHLTLGSAGSTVAVIAEGVGDSSVQSLPFTVPESAYRASLLLTFQALPGPRLFLKRKQMKNHDVFRGSR